MTEAISIQTSAHPRSTISWRGAGWYVSAWNFSDATREEWWEEWRVAFSDATSEEIERLEAWAFRSGFSNPRFYGAPPAAATAAAGENGEGIMYANGADISAALAELAELPELGEADE